MKLLELKSNNLEELIDITDYVKDYIKESNLENGTITIQTINNTCSILGLSSQNGDVTKNFFLTINRLYPLMDGMHFVGHDIKCIRSGMIGTSRTYIVADKEPVLGAFEKIYLAEFAGPSDRLIVILEATPVSESLSPENNPAKVVQEFRDEFIRLEEEKKREEERAVQEMREEWLREHADDPRFKSITQSEDEETEEIVETDN